MYIFYRYILTIYKKNSNENKNHFSKVVNPLKLYKYSICKKLFNVNISNIYLCKI